MGGNPWKLSDFLTCIDNNIKEKQITQKINFEKLKQLKPNIKIIRCII